MAPAQVATARESDRQRASMKFTTEAPGQPTGLRVKIDYFDPDDEDAKPPAVSVVLEKLARGARIDTSVPARCGASDAELIAEGEDACPSRSRVGDGEITIDTGFPEPGRFLAVDVTFLNNDSELIFLSTERQSGARVVSRAPIEGRTFTSTAPPLPGTPPDGGAIDTVDVKLDRISDGGGAYLRTPRRCPDSGRWVNKLRFTYRDGETRSERSGSPCD
jgi:hypothetical protein